MTIKDIFNELEKYRTMEPTWKIGIFNNKKDMEWLYMSYKCG